MVHPEKNTEGSTNSMMNKYLLLPIGREHFIAFWVSTLMIVGRWNFSRLTGIIGDIGILNYLYEPRTILIGIALFFLILQPPRHLVPQYKGYHQAIIFCLLTILLSLIELFSVGQVSNGSISIAEEIARKRLDVFFILVMTICLTIELVRCNPRRLIYLIWCMLFFYVALFTLLSLVNSLNSLSSLSSQIQQQRVSALGGGPNVFARFMIFCALFSLFHFIYSVRFYQKGLFGFFFIAALLLLFLTGSRGGWLAFFIGMIIFFRKNIQRLQIPIIPTIGLSIIIWIVVSFTPLGGLLENMWRIRFVEQTLTQQHSSGRTEIYSEALSTITTHFWTGVGLGQYIAYNTGGHRYPHNLFLEIMVESGIMGLLIISTMILSVLFWGIFLTQEQHPYFYLSYVAFIALLVATQFSGDIYDSRSIFLLGIMVLASRIEIKDHKSNTIEA